MVTFLPDQDETVYNYAKPEPVIEPKPPRYFLLTHNMLIKDLKNHHLE